MRLFTCKKYNFLIEKNLPSLSASKLSASLFSRLVIPPKNKGGTEPVSQRICRNSDRFIFGSKYLGLVMDKRISLLPKKPNSSQKIQNCAPFDSY